MLTVDSKVSLGSFRAGEQLSNCYEQILEIPIDRFPTSTIELTSSLDEAVLSSSSSPNPSASEYGFATRVARSFDAAAIKRETTRKEAAKNKAEKLALARERRRQEKDEIRRHKLALRAEATREKEIRATRQIELCRLRSEVYKAGVTRAEAERNHQRSIAEAVADGQREARLEVAWNSGRETEMLRREASENEGPKGFRRVGSAKPNRELIDKSAHRRCAKSAKRLRDERTRMVTKACDALRVAKQNIHNAMDVPYPDEGTQRKVLKSRELVHEALSELHGLVADGQSNTVT